MRLLQSLALIIITTSAVQAQRLVKLNLLEKSPLANMVVYSMNDSTANYTKLVAGTGIQITYNENDTTLTITATGTSVGVPQTLSLNDGTRVLSISDGNSVDLSESIQEEVNAMLVAGDNVTLTYNDVANTLTIASTGGGGGATNIGDLGDVTITSATTGQVLKYDGAAWINGVDLNTETLGALLDVDTTGKADGSILLYDETAGEWQAQANSINNLTDASYDDVRGNVIIGDTTNIPFLTAPNNTANIGIGRQLFRGFNFGQENLLIGTRPMHEADSSSRNVSIGKNTGGGHGKEIGLPYSNKHNFSTFLGQFAGGLDSLTYKTIIIGQEANMPPTASFPGQTVNGVLIGAFARMGTKNSVDEITIGANAIGNGDSTVTIGKPFYKGTYLNGNLNLSGYGAGNKEAADLGKTGSGYFLEVATDGTLIESTVTGGTAQTLSFDDATRELSISSGNTVDLSEGIQDEIAATVTAGEGITLTYDDALGTLTVAAPAGAGNTDEQTLSINNSTAELTISNGNTVDLSEAIDNQVNTLTVAGTNIAKVYDDGANTLTLSTTDALTAIDAITFDANTTTEVANRLQFNTEYNTLTFGMANATPIRIGQDLGWLVKNQTGTTIAKGVAVMAVGTVGASGRILIDELVADGSVDAHYFLGVTAEPIANGADGFVTSQGHIRGINTSLFTSGAVLYASPSTPGAFTTTEPTGNDLKLPLAFVLNSDPTNGEIAVRADLGASIKDLHDVDVTGITDNSILKYNNTSGTWEIGTDLEESTTAANGLTLSGTDVKLGGTLSDATTTIDMNSNALTFTNNGGYNLSGTGGLSFTNTSATDYSSVLSIASTNTRIYADGGTTEPLNSLNLTSTRSGVKELDLRSSISNDNTTYTMIALNPTRFSMKTPNVTDLTATNGQFLKLVDRLTGEVEFADALTAEVDGSVTNEIQDLSLTGNTLSLSSDATTVDLSPYLDDQTVTLTGGGITAISGTYPNFTITSTEVDGSVSNEGLLSASTLISGTTAALTSNTNGGSSVNFTANTGLAIGSSGGNTITFTNTLPEATTASNGLTETGNNIALGGDLTSTTIVDLNSQNLYLVDDGATGVGVSILPASNEVAATGNLSVSADLLLTSYGLGNNTGTSSGYLAGFASDGTMIEIAESTFLTSDQTTASNGLTLSGTNVKLGGTLTEITNIAMGGFNASIFDVTSSTGLAIQPSINEVIMYGTQSFTDYGSGNKEAGDLSKTFSGHYAGFATDGTVIEVNALPITSGTSATIDWGNMPQRIHVLDFGANTSLTLSFSNVLAGGIYTLRVTGNSGTDTLVWPAAAKFEDGTSVGTVTLQNGGQMFTFYWDGTNYWVK